MECGICDCAQAMWYVVDRLEPWEQFLFCTSWGHSQKCSTGSMVVAVKHSYLILGRDEGYSFLIDDIYASCLGCVTSVIKVIWKACCWCLLAGDACQDAAKSSCQLHFGSCFTNTIHLPAIKQKLPSSD